MPAAFSHGTETPSNLQRRSGLGRAVLAAHPDRDPGFSVFRIFPAEFVRLVVLLMIVGFPIALVFRGRSE